MIRPARIDFEVIPPHIVRYIEGELREAPLLRNRMDDMRDDVYLGGSNRNPQEERGDRVSDPTASKVQVFLSHAKHDGLAITTTVRRHLHEVANLDDFFDAADVPDGTRFAEFIKKCAGAVPALAFGQAAAAVDVTAQLVLARAVAAAPISRREAQSLAARLVPAGDPWRFNQAMFDLGARFCVGRRPACHACPVASCCRWLAHRGRAAAGGAGHAAGADAGAAADPAEPRRRQTRFDGSDRQGRGRLVDALRRGPLAREVLACAAGWPGDDERAQRVAGALCADGVACWDGGRLALA